MFLRILDNIQNNLLIWIVGATLSGLLIVNIFGGYAFTPLICLLAAIVMIYPSMVPLSFGKLKEAFRDKKIILISLLLNFIFAPISAYFIGMLFLEKYPALWAGLMLLALLPGGGMATTWALKSKSEMSTVIGIIFTNLLVAVMVVPFALSFLMENFSKLGDVSSDDACSISKSTGGIFSCASGEISPAKIAIAMFFIVVIPLVFAFFTQLLIKRKKGFEYFENKKVLFGKFSNAGLVFILFALMSLESNVIIFKEPRMILLAIFPIVIFYFLHYLVVFQAYTFLGKNSKAKSFVWGSYLRYITLALGISISLVYQNPELSLMTIPIVIAYFIQIPSSFFISKKFERT